MNVAKISESKAQMSKNQLCEVVITSSLNSPYVFHNNGVSLSDDTLIIHVPECRCTLKVWLTENHSWNEKFKLCAQVARGLHDLHEFGFYHYGISPDNVMIMKDGGAVLRGFEHAAKIQPLTIHGERYYPPYVAPEFDWSRPYCMSEATEVFALGRLFMDFMEDSDISLVHDIYSFIQTMCSAEPEQRPTMQRVNRFFSLFFDMEPCKAPTYLPDTLHSKSLYETALKKFQQDTRHLAENFISAKICDEFCHRYTMEIIGLGRQYTSELVGCVVLLIGYRVCNSRRKFQTVINSIVSDEDVAKWVRRYIIDTNGVLF